MLSFDLHAIVFRQGRRNEVPADPDDRINTCAAG
jgi:hypothetical protein